MSRPQNRHLRPNPQTLGVEPLAEGEVSRPVRVRAPAWVHERLKAMTAREIGRVLTDSLDRPRDD
jgi:hypothetical protein